jgi:multidrug resistance efflux pump
VSTSSELFRKKALSKYLRIDAPGALLTITPPWSLAVFGAMALLFVALALLATFGHAQLAAEGRGVVRPNEPAIVLRAPFAGTVLSVAAGVRTNGKAGQLLLAMDARAESRAHDRCVADIATDRAELASLEKRLADWNESTERDRNPSMALVLLSQIRNQREKTASETQRCDAVGTLVERSAVTFPVDASVEDVAVAAGGQVHEGDVLATLIPASAHVVGYLALGEQYRSELSPGLPVKVKFDALPVDEVGAGSARVARILDALPSGVKIDAAPGASVFAELSLDAMPAGSGPARPGMTFTGDVLTRRRRVLALLFGGPSDEP